MKLITWVIGVAVTVLFFCKPGDVAAQPAQHTQDSEAKTTGGFVTFKMVPVAVHLLTDMGKPPAIVKPGAERSARYFENKTGIFRPDFSPLPARPSDNSKLSRSPGFAGNPAYHNPRGPIPIRDARPFNILFLQFTPETADVLPAGSSKFGAQLDIINNLLIPNPALGATVIEQNEYQRLRFTWKRGIDRQTEIGISAPLLWRNGGFLDDIITAYHHLTGLQDNAQDVPLGRDHYPKYQSRLELVDSSGRVLVNKGNAFGLGETMLTVKHSLFSESRRSSMALRLGIKLPTGNPTLILGSGSVDAGASLDARYSAGRDVIFYGNLGYVVMGPAIKVPGGRPNTLETLVGVEYRANNRDSFIAQIDGNGQFVRTGNRFADGSNVTATFGYWRVLDRHHVGFLSFSEAGHIHNFTLPSLSNIGPGFTVSLGLTWIQ